MTIQRRSESLPDETVVHPSIILVADSGRSAVSIANGAFSEHRRHDNDGIGLEIEARTLNP